MTGHVMAAPAERPANCPPGLEYLTMIDQLLVKQKVEMLEAFTGFETNNKYVVKNTMGQQVNCNVKGLLHYDSWNNISC